MVDVPDATPFTRPLLFTVATAVLVLLHMPPVAPSLNNVVEPPHTVAVPLIVPAADVPLTVTTCVAATVPQVLVTVYDMVDVPDATPLTSPLLFTVAAEVLVLLHAPPVAPSLNDVVEPTHTVAVPLIVPATGNGLTVTIWETDVE